MREITTKYPATGQGGVLVANGYKNIAYFRNFTIIPFQAGYRISSCVAGTSGVSGNHFVLDANHGSWPKDGFCSALNEEVKLNTENYAISAQLFNKIGWNGVNSGHLGILYNAKNSKNYDFVYFRYRITRVYHPLQSCSYLSEISRGGTYPRVKWSLITLR